MVGSLNRSHDPGPRWPGPARRAFSIVELLVVVAVLLVLAGIVATAASRAKRQGTVPVCASNLKQLAQALDMYLPDGQRQLPWGLYGDFSPILPYIGDPKILQCPLDPYKSGANWQVTRRTGHRTSYYSVVTIEELFMQRLAELDPNHGVFVCLTHGEMTRAERRRPPSVPPGPEHGYEGLVLRVRFDSSVQHRKVYESCYETPDGGKYSGRSEWEFFTDEPIPHDVKVLMLGVGPDFKEVPCGQWFK
jgi:prepilin-type N-terminal cleavage/methylation domain-containing protein